MPISARNTRDAATAMPRDAACDRLCAPRTGGIGSQPENTTSFSASHPCFFAYRLQRAPHCGMRLHELEGFVTISVRLEVLTLVQPAVGTPEPGGLGWYEVLKLCRRVVQKCTIVGFDVMELLPAPQSVAPDVLAARLVYKLLSYIFMDKV